MLSLLIRSKGVGRVRGFVSICPERKKENIKCDETRRIRLDVKDYSLTFFEPHQNRTRIRACLGWGLCKDVLSERMVVGEVDIVAVGG